MIDPYQLLSISLAQNALSHYGHLHCSQTGPASPTDLSPSYWIEDAQTLGVLSNILLSVHAILFFLYAIACPLAAVSAAVDALVNDISDLRIRFWSWRKTFAGTTGEIYVFHELEEHGTALVRNLIETRKEKMPLIIFANVGDAEASRDDTLMEEILDQARGYANVLTPRFPRRSFPANFPSKRSRDAPFAPMPSPTTAA